MRFFVYLAAIILFIVAALIAFFLDEVDVTLRSIVGIVSVGLACLTIAATPAPPRNL